MHILPKCRYVLLRIRCSHAVSSPWHVSCKGWKSLENRFFHQHMQSPIEVQMKARFIAIFIPSFIVLSATFLFMHIIFMGPKSPGHPHINHYDAKHIIVASITGFICAGLIALLSLYIIRLKKTVRDNNTLTESLRSSELHLNVLFDDAPDAYFILDTHGTILNGNKAASKMIGYRKEEAVGKTFAELKIMPEEQIPRALENLANLEESPEHSPAEFTLLHRNGSVSEVEISKYPVMLDGSLKMLCIAHNITERKRRTADVITSEAKYRSLIANIPGVTWTSDIHGNATFISPNVTNITGFTPEEMYHMGSELWFGRIHPDDRERIITAFRELFEKGTPVSVEFRYKAKDEKWIWLQDTAHSAYEKDGVVMADGVFIDITDRKENEITLRKSAMIIDRTSDAVVGADTEGTITFWNTGAEHIFGYRKDEAIGKPISMLYKKEHLHVLHSIVKDAMSGKPIRNVESLRIGKDGREIQTLLSVTTIKAEDGTIKELVGIFKDVTEQKNLANQLRMAQKMEAVGQLTGGVAHDFNNVLNAIMGFSSLIDMQVPSDHPSKAHIAQIIRAAERGAALTKGLLSVGRRQVMNPINVNVNLIIQDLKKMLSRIIREDIEFMTNLSDENLTIMADPTQIEQILMNLVTNARDAMPDGGYLSISTERFEITNEFIELHQYGTTGDYLLLSVVDTGEGISKEDQEKIFEPFYSTKEMGKGTGLGLAIVYGIVKQHKGYINVYSEKGHGTTFRIYFPLTNNEPEKIPVKASGKYLTGSETILVAEDDSVLRGLAKEILETQGYTVLLAENGEAAVDMFRKHKDEIQLLILDVIMPRMNGKEAYKEILTIEPGIKAIFLSGYAPDMIDQSDLICKNMAYLQKPVHAKQLLTSVKLAFNKKIERDLV